MTKIGIFGSNGRMGRALIEACKLNDEVELSQAIVRESSAFLGMDVGEIAGIGKLELTTTSLTAQTELADVYIDFTLPDASIENIKWCVANKKPVVIGTTGFNKEQLAQIDEAGKQIPVVFAANMSVGVNLLFKLLETAAKVMGDYTDIEIWEAHHRYKKDAPSGTALALGQVIADTLKRDLDECAIYGREGNTGERDPNTIGFATIRAGDIVGEHTAMFADIGERIEITHKASSRLTFAKGAVRAAHWLAGKPVAKYDMQDVLGLKD
ncbi:4-hydroxy-tetrahydrodipicolinate reductase [Catenovulum sp. 2E275]|uniref:4-hydroxy-tetrahydrodipicolinate reductase n=1 Tax=Catenovulum sp. 2E275 TaxID=2980497 RepID=UPI0021CFE9C2|nr:4-hydroxy-tetrahydrodipicolinate reductase [Catenovulum sp. 2E275]MCU4676758.1 4-hydroxy-tetrahydrodipicolinate reductase [Catenovulum sp. 2E275]